MRVPISQTKRNACLKRMTYILKSFFTRNITDPQGFCYFSEILYVILEDSSCGIFCVIENCIFPSELPRKDGKNGKKFVCKKGVTIVMYVLIVLVNRLCKVSNGS